MNADSEFAQRLAEWRRQPSIETTLALLEVAAVTNRLENVSEAADKILTAPKSEVSAAGRRLAEGIRGIAPAEAAVPPIGEDVAIDVPLVRQQIRRYRRLLIQAPRNPLLWVDMARAYCVIGQVEKSGRAMDAALSLAPDNRFVLRSAARLFVHSDDPDRALSVLRKSGRTQHDPWLIAAEMAVALVAERSSSFDRRGRQILSSGNHAPHQMAELASAMATADLQVGDDRRARRLFRQSLIDPTENAVAQAEWASARLSGVDVAPEVLRQANSHEAQALSDYRAGQWAAIVSDCRQWLGDEPFSSRPATFGSYVSSVALQDYRSAEAFARAGLTANPDEPLLINNLVVALASQGRVAEAKREFARVSRGLGESLLDATLIATEGLLRFRSGDVEGGRFLYHHAIRVAGKSGASRFEALAATHLAREEVLAQTAEAMQAIANSVRLAEKVEALEVKQMVQAVEREAAARVRATG